MSLKSRVNFIIGLVVIALFGITYVVSRSIIYDGFLRVEEEHINDHITRVEEAILNQIDQLGIKSADWSQWDDAYKYVQDRNQAFADSNLNAPTLLNLKINYLIFVNDRGEKVFGRAVDLDKSEETEFPSSLDAMLATGSSLLKHSKLGDVRKGVILLPEGPLMIVSSPITSSDGKSPIKGSFLMGRYLDDTEIAFISKITKLKIDVKEYRGGTNDGMRDVGKLLRSEEKIEGTGFMKDVSGLGGILIKVSDHREIYLEGEKSVRIFSFYMAILGFSLVATSIFIVNKLIIGRLSKLTDDIGKIRDHKISSNEIHIEGNDEFSKLTSEIANIALDLQNSNDVLSRTKTELEQKVKFTEEQNKSLQDTKLAMMNILEDERVLQGELEKQKSDVERQIATRTKELFQEHARLGSSINSLTSGFIMTDVAGMVIMMNKAAEKLLDEQGISSVLNNSNHIFNLRQIGDFQKLFPEDFNFGKHIQDCIVKKVMFQKESVQFGGKIVHLTISPIISGPEDALSNGVIGSVISIRDITEIKQNERARDEFFSIASHELRTPLTAIKGNSSMIRDMYADKLTDPDLKQMIDDIHDASLRLIAIVNDFLNMSRLEQGKMVFKLEPLKINDLVVNLVKEVQSMADDKKLEIVVQPEVGSSPTIVADGDRLKEVMLNLLSNAIKFTEIGKIVISSEVEGKYLLVKISDEGKGIPIENRDLLFKKFQQASNNILTRDTTRSTGLGLYISKLLMNGMKGEIYLEKSDEGKGSTFTIKIPLAV